MKNQTIYVQVGVDENRGCISLGDICTIHELLSRYGEHVDYCIYKQEQPESYKIFTASFISLDITYNNRITMEAILQAMKREGLIEPIRGTNSYFSPTKKLRELLANQRVKSKS